MEMFRVWWEKESHWEWWIATVQVTLHPFIHLWLVNSHSPCLSSSLDWLWTPQLPSQLGALVLAFLSLFPWCHAFNTQCLSWEIGSICLSYLLAQHYQHTLPSLQCHFPGAPAAVTCGWALSGTQWLSCHSVFLWPALKCSLGWNTCWDTRHSAAVGLQSCEALKEGYSGMEQHFEVMRVERPLFQMRMAVAWHQCWSQWLLENSLFLHTRQKHRKQLLVWCKTGLRRLSPSSLYLLDPTYALGFQSNFSHNSWVEHVLHLQRALCYRCIINLWKVGRFQAGILQNFP